MYIYYFFVVNITVFSKMQFSAIFVFKSVIYCQLANFSEVKKRNRDLKTVSDCTGMTLCISVK